MLTETEVRAALDEVIHPSFGMSLITLGMVRAIRTNAEEIEVDLVMNCPGCPASEVAVAHARQKLAELPVDTVRLNLLPEVWTLPWE